VQVMLSGLRLAGRAPNLIYDYGHHEQQVDPKRPKNEYFKSLQLAPGNMLLSPCELVLFERRQNQGFFGGVYGMFLSRHLALLPAAKNR
jgi:hypothetical protein